MVSVDIMRSESFDAKAKVTPCSPEDESTPSTPCRIV